MEALLLVFNVPPLSKWFAHWESWCVHDDEVCHDGSFLQSNRSQIFLQNLKLICWCPMMSCIRSAAVSTKLFVLQNCNCLWAQAMPQSTLQASFENEFVAIASWHEKGLDVGKIKGALKRSWCYRKEFILYVFLWMYWDTLNMGMPTFQISCSSFSFGTHTSSGLAKPIVERICRCIDVEQIQLPDKRDWPNPLKL